MEIEKLKSIIRSAYSNPESQTVQRGFVDGWLVKGERPGKVYAKYRGTDLKKTFEFRGRLINYGEKADIKEGHENGTIERRDRGWETVERGIQKDPKTGQHYLSIDFSKLSNPYKSQWYLNGNPVNREEIEHMLTSAERRQGEKRDWTTVKSDNVVDLIHKNLK